MGDRGRSSRERAPPNRMKASGSASAARNNSASSRKSAPAPPAGSGSSKKKKSNDLDSLSDASRALPVMVSQLSTPSRPNSRNLPASGITAENETSDHDDDQDEELDESQNLDEDDDEEEEEEEEEEGNNDDELLNVGASRLVENFASPQVHITST